VENFQRRHVRDGIEEMLSFRRGFLQLIACI
jgi:hypothetical protein